MGDVVLAGKSILENVALRVEGAKEEMVKEVCGAALFHEIVRGLMDGYEMILGGGSAAGVALSGGQKQSLAIASARLRNPSVLVLDRRSYCCSALKGPRRPSTRTPAMHISPASVRLPCHQNEKDSEIGRLPLP